MVDSGVTGDSLISTDAGLLIASAVDGDRVLTLSGDYNKVNQISISNYAGDFFIIQCLDRKLVCSGNTELFVHDIESDDYVFVNASTLDPRYHRVQLNTTVYKDSKKIDGTVGYFSFTISREPGIHFIYNFTVENSNTFFANYFSVKGI